MIASVKVWILMFAIAGAQAETTGIVDNIVTEEECRRLGTEMQQARKGRAFTFQCFEAEKALN